MSKPPALPEPLTPADCDLRDFAFMPLDVVRLRDSQLAVVAEGDEFRSAVLLWCVAWHQVPAGSLPDDDKMLAQYAGYGRVVKEWQKVREGALRGFVKCSDGRLYHQVICEKAAESWKRKREHEEARTAERERKKRQRSGGQAADASSAGTTNSAGQDGDVPRDKGDLSAGQEASVPRDKPPLSGGTSAGIPPENALKGQGEGEDREKETPPRPPSESPPRGSGGGGRASSDPAGMPPERQVAAHFVAVRERLWPTESRLPAPLLTLDAEAKPYLDQGVTAQFLTEFLDQQLADLAAKGEAAPTSLAFFRLSLPKAVKRHQLAAHRPAAAGQSPGSAPGDDLPHPDGEDNRWRLRVKGFQERADRWRPMWGPAPGEHGCQVPRHILAELGLLPAQGTA